MFFKAGTVTDADIAPGLQEVGLLAVDSARKRIHARTGDADWPSVGLNAYPAGAADLSGAKWVPFLGAGLATGDSDLYTVPAGKQAIVDRLQMILNFPGSGGNIVAFAEIKVGGIYYRIGPNVTVADGAGSFLNSQIPIVLQAGDSISVNTTTTNGLNIRGGAWEWDATDTRLFSARLLGGSVAAPFASGDNTLYTCPPGKTAALIGAQATMLTGGGGCGALTVANNTGGSLNYYINQVPSGSSVANGNRITAVTAIADKTSTALNLGTIGPGDIVSVNASGPDAGGHHIAWFTAYQLP